MSCPLKRLMELAASFSETDRRPKNIMLRLPYTEQNYHIQQYDADFDKQKLFTVKVDYTKNIMNLPTIVELNALRDECYKIACEHGWHDEEHSERHFLCLVITELCEAVEADRKDRHADLKSFNQSVETDYVPIATAFEGYIKDSVEDELADAAIRILDLAGKEDFYLGYCDDDDFYNDGVLGVSLRTERSYFKKHSFTESVFTIVEEISDRGWYVALHEIFILADVMGIDLMEHIRLKMQYNRTRERLHGKKY